MSKDPVFISGVSSEFEKVREEIKTDLETMGIWASTQRTFRHGANDTGLLVKLHDAIRDCKIVVCIHGSRSGSSPPAPAAAQYAELLPRGLEEASYTQWEFHFAKYWKKTIYFFRATEQYVPDRPEGHDLAGSQQKFLAYVSQTDRFYQTFSTGDELCRKVSLQDWSKALPAEGSSWLMRFFVIVSLFVLMNVISALSGAPTVMAFFSSDILSRPSGKSNLEFFLSEHVGHTLFMAKTAESLRIDFPPALDLGAYGCIKPDAPPSSISLPVSCKYDSTTKEYSIAADGKALKKNPGFWLFNRGDVSSSYSFMRTTPDGKTDGQRWFVKFREEGEPCIALDSKTKCFPLGEYGASESDTPQQKELRKQIYFNQLQLESRYDLITEKLKTLIFAFALGFSALISAMAHELTGLFATFSGKVDRRARAAI
jgi:hypothetical protein